MVARSGATRMAELRAKRRRPCGICRRVHPGRCLPEDQRSDKFGITLPGWLGRRLRARIAWGDRSRWIAQLIEAELDRLDALGDEESVA